jgi:hypothetical protein
MMSGGTWAPWKLIALVSLLLGNMAWGERPSHTSPQTKTCDRTPANAMPLSTEELSQVFGVTVVEQS